MNQIFPDLTPYIHVLQLNLEKLTRQGKPTPRTIVQWTGFSSWSIKNFCEKPLDADLTQYIRDEASDWATEYLAELAKESLASSAVAYMSSINPFRIMNPLAAAAQTVWTNMSLDRAMSSIWQDAHSKHQWLNNFDDMDLSTFKCDCDGRGKRCPLSGIENRIQQDVLDDKTFSAAATGTAKTIMAGSGEAADSIHLFKDILESAQEFQQELSQIAQFANDAPTEACIALYQGMAEPTRTLITELHQSATRGTSGKGCKRSQASIALILGELTMTANGGILYDNPNVIGQDFTAYPKTLAVLSNPAGICFVAGALHGLSV